MARISSIPIKVFKNCLESLKHLNGVNSILQKICSVRITISACSCIDTAIKSVQIQLGDELERVALHHLKVRELSKHRTSCVLCLSFVCQEWQVVFRNDVKFVYKDQRAELPTVSIIYYQTNDSL